MTPDPCNPAREAGIYILANDCVLEYAKALFRSLRHFNPSIPAYVIPFDGRMDAIAREARAFRIGIYDAPHADDLDAMAAACFGESGAGQRMFRKFTAFWGPLETFLYLDVDIALLDDPAKLLRVFGRADCDFLSFDCDEDRAYLPGPLRDEMQRLHGSRSFNAGAFLSRRGLFTMEQVRRLAEEARPHQKEFAPYLGDQPFFNYALDKSGARHRRLPEVVPHAPEKTWSDRTPIAWREGAYRVLDPASPDCGKALPFIHWAGHAQGDAFPNRALFYRFRLQGASPWQAALYKLADRWRWTVPPLCNRLRHLGKRLLQRLRILPS
ncbi:MAG: hypothetical protein PHQ12_03790 [Chthoniobacteraceae bacterium]|nr:hypothetical protein [Chthoniobacteraceae bacterium]